MALGTEHYLKLGNFFNQILAQYNYQVAPIAPAGKPGKIVKTVREYRLQLIDKNRDTSDKLIGNLGAVLKSASKDISGVQYHPISPNSSKFPSYGFKFDGQSFDLVIGRGANKGENFETNTVTGLATAFSTRKTSSDYADVIKQLNESNKDFAAVEIKSVTQRKGSTKKEGVPIEKLGAIIGDIVLTDTTNNNWFVSLKDVNGDTFSSYSGAASLFNAQGELQPKSAGAEFLNAFGVDLNQIQAGFDLRNNKKALRKRIKIEKANPTEIKKIFERAWGMNYFYVRKTTSGWKVFWLDRKKLNDFTSNIVVTDIRYPTLKSKQITIYCGNRFQNYVIELRNSKAGEYPNDTKFKTK
jgi:hypothetical protein